MVTLTAGLKNLIPGSLIFLVAVTALGTALLFGPPRAVRWGRRLLASIVILYLALSLQGVNDLLIAGLRGPYTSLRTRDEARGATAIVVLSNGAVRIDLGTGGVDILNAQSAYNALEAARLYALLGQPKILASGGPERLSEARGIADVLIGLGVPRSDIALEESSWNTRTQAEFAVRWLRAQNVSTFVVVTTPEHARRAAGTFKALGTDPIMSLSAIDYGGPPFWRPTYYAMRGSANVIYEYLAWFYYWASGRL